jgi:hypothetical protein
MYERACLVVCAGLDERMLTNVFTTKCTSRAFAGFFNVNANSVNSHNMYPSRLYKPYQNVLFHVEQSDFLFHAETSPCTFLFVPSLVQVGTMAVNLI